MLSDSAILSVNKITKSFGDTCIFKDISFELNEGEVLSVLGQSGVGKTTLLRVIANLTLPCTGSVSIPEVNKDKIGFVFQNYFIFPWLCVRQNVEFGQAEKNSEDVDRILADVGLLEYRDSPTNNLSGGQLQRLAVARSMILKPKLLLMDEPFSDLDVHNKSKLYELVRGLVTNHKMSFIIVTHDVSESVKISDRIVVLSGIPASVGNTFVVRDFARNELENEIIKLLNKSHDSQPDK